MLEGLAAWILNNYLGQYFENLNTDQLSVGLLQGDVELEGLPLKRQALAAVAANLDLPIEVRAGIVGKVRLHVPLTCLRSEPCTLSMERLYLIVGPIPPNRFEEEQADKATLEHKFVRLDRMEAKWRSDQEAKQATSYYASSYTTWVSYGTSIVSSILENVQITIKDVHVRFEDEFTDPNCPVACGVVLESLTAQSSSDQWVCRIENIPRSVSGDGSGSVEDGKARFKLVTLHRLSVYWDAADQVKLIGDLGLSEMADAMKEMSEAADRRYVVEPVSFEARLRRNVAFSGRPSSSPRFVCDFLLDRLPVALTKDQYERMVSWRYELHRLDRARRYRRWRPVAPIDRRGARDWWRFAAKPLFCEHRLRYRGRNWPFVLRRAKDNVLYVKAYTEHLTNPATCPAAFTNHKDSMERDVPFEELVLLREVAMQRVTAAAVAAAAAAAEQQRNKMNDDPKAKGAGLLQRWFPLWGGWYSTDIRKDPASETEPKAAEAMGLSQRLEDEILEALNDINDADAQEVMAEDAIFATLHFALKHGTFVLQDENDDDDRHRFELSFADVSCLMELRPRRGLTSYRLCLGTLSLRDTAMARSLFPTSVEPQARDLRTPVGGSGKYLRTLSSRSDEEDDDEPLLSVVYEMRPRRHKSTVATTADFRLHVKSRSLDIVYNESSLRRLVAFFTLPFRHSDYRVGSDDGLASNWRQRVVHDDIGGGSRQTFTRRWDIDFDISAPLVVLPDRFFASDSTIVVCDFGRLRFRTHDDSNYEDDDDDEFRTPCSTPPVSSDEEEDDDQMEEGDKVEPLSEASLRRRVYDNYSLELCDLRVLVCQATADGEWRRTCRRATSATDMHVVDRFSVSLLIERRTIDAVDWPSVVITASVPSLAVHLNERKLDICRRRLSSTWTTSSSSKTRPSPPFMDDNDDTASLQDSHRLAVVVFNFDVHRMCLDVQSRGQSVAELQISGIRSTATVRPSRDATVSLTVHGLLLVDALQTYGPDYELLVASHRHVSIDSASGSLCDDTTVSSSSDALITIDLMLTRQGRGQSDTVAGQIHFNNLDVTANQQTIAELVAFVGQVSPRDDDPDCVVEQREEDPTTAVAKDGANRLIDLSLTFDFRRLSVLFFKADPPSSSSDEATVAWKVATVTMSDARVRTVVVTSNATVVEVDGSLGSLRVSNPTADATRHATAQVLSVGRTGSTSATGDEEKALVFRVANGRCDNDRATVSLALRVASVHYVHSMLFVSDLGRCIVEFGRHMTFDLASAAVETAAAEVAGLCREVDLRLDVILESPVVVLPETRTSDNVLVARPGRIVLTTLYSDQIAIEVSDASLFSRDREGKEFPILHETVVAFTVDRCAPSSDGGGGRLGISGRVVSPFKVSLSKRQYKQILKTFQDCLANGDIDRYTCDSGLTAAITTSHDSKATATNSFAIKFELPELQIVLFGDLAEMQRPLVSLSFQDFLVDHRVQTSPSPRTTMTVTVRALFMEDLLKDPDSKHRFLVKSSSKTRSSLGVPVVDSKDRRRHRCLSMTSSSSCPDVSRVGLFGNCDRSSLQLSLPDRLNTENVFQHLRRLREKCLFGRLVHQRRRSLEDGHGRRMECPRTPPPSPRVAATDNEIDDGDNALVVVVKILPDDHFYDFDNGDMSPYTSVDVKLNCLDTVINVHSWVVVMDLFGIGETSSPSLTDSTYIVDRGDTIWPTEVKIRLRRLTSMLNKDEHELARIDASDFQARVRHATGRRVSVAGKLGHVSLMDLTCVTAADDVGHRQRFTTDGESPLHFRFAVGGDDGCYATVALDVPSVRYVHTNRFAAELIAFVHHFRHVRELMSQSRADATGHVERRPVPPTTTVLPRIRLDIDVRSPIVVLPVGPSSSTVFVVVDLGRLSLTTGSPATIHDMIDVVVVQPMDVDLYMAQWNREGDDGRRPSSSTDHGLRKVGASLLTSKCRLDLQVQRNLHCAFDHSAADVRVDGQLSAVHFTIDVEQYRVIRGVLVDDFTGPVSMTSTSEKTTAKTTTKNDDDNWIRLSVGLDLVDVVVDLHDDSSTLARVRLSRSKVTYEYYTNDRVDVHFVSQEIVASDVRRDGIGADVIRPKRTRTDSSQVEVHVGMSADRTRVTVLLDGTRVVAIVDWWTPVIDFLCAGADEEKKDDRRGRQTTITTTMADGVVTKRGLGGSRLELKIVATETSVAIMGDISSADVVVIKATAVVAHRPGADHSSISLRRLEVFSCVAGREDETALSMVDPATVTVELVPAGRRSSPSPDVGRGLLDSFDERRIVDVSVQDLNVRLSYHDVRLLLRLMQSLQRRSAVATDDVRVEENDDDDSVASKHLASSIARLRVLGFERSDCARALEACDERLDAAALWLTAHATHVETVDDGDVDREGGPWRMGAKVAAVIDALCVDVHANHLRLCLIDDRRDDVPLVEFTVDDLRLWHGVDLVHRVRPPSSSASSSNVVEGRAQFAVHGDYYNRNLSGWEPFVEPWTCVATWRHVPSTVDPSSSSLLSVDVTGQGVLDLNVTSTLLDLYRKASTDWTEDYHRQDVDNGRRHRSPFMPFVLKNDTGCRLKFCAVTSSSDGFSTSAAAAPAEWIDVEPGDTTSFAFEAPTRTRRRQDTHDFDIRRLIVNVEGWRQVDAISVDKVGMFFRYMRPLHAKISSSRSSLPTTRIVFVVTLDDGDGARKLVTVRSALTLVNRLDATVELRLENSTPRVGATHTALVLSGRSYAVPLPFVSTAARLFARPIGSDDDPPFLYCHSAIQWQHANRSSQFTHTCAPTSTRPGARHFRFCARVRRDDYPMADAFDAIPSPVSMATARRHGPHEIGHEITLVPPVVLVNLLPNDLTYEVRPYADVRGFIVGGREAHLHFVDVGQTFYVALCFDNFRVVNALVVPGNCLTGFDAILQARDICDRVLLLRATVRGGPSSIRIAISAPYWLMNRTGLPLVFLQHGCADTSSSSVAAGQFAEHEMARSVAPLLFSFSDDEAPPLCSMRVGRSIHSDVGGRPQWCHAFHLRPGVRVRRLHVVASSDSATASSSSYRWVYEIGIEVSHPSSSSLDDDDGRHYTVTLTPRFQFVNGCTSLALEFTQKCRVDSSDMSSSVIEPGAVLPFHWPRPDRDRLLCIRVASVVGCGWSGGLVIERTDSSCHVNMRDSNGVPRFVRMRSALRGATYVVTFADDDPSSHPPPLRLDNLSEVPVTCHQAGVENVERLRLCLRPHASVPYAWDEPTLPPVVTCLAPGGCGASYSLAGLGASRIHLSYENFIYVTFVGGDITAADSRPSSDLRDLVLDVPHGSLRVILALKEPGRRSQLWRMTSDGMLQHEGSSPPIRGGSQRSSAHTDTTDRLVLDIEDMAPRPLEYVRLVLRKPDKRRALTQHWEFTGDSRLCCRLTTNALFVQPRDGFHGLRPGAEVVLGPSRPIRYALTKTGVPVEQVVSRRRLWSGSGLLGIDVTTDGPTRVLQIVDIGQRKALVERLDGDNVDVAATQRRSRVHVKVTMSLPGVGVSLVNRTPEELVYVSLVDVVAELIRRSSGERRLEGTVRRIQVDDQLTDAECPVLLYVTPTTGGADSTDPAVRFVVHRLRSRHSNVEVFADATVVVKDLSVRLDERLLWSLCHFFGLYVRGGDAENGDATTIDRHVDDRYYYFDASQLVVERVRLSLITASSDRLTDELRAIRRRSGRATLVRFEDALVELDPFVRDHLYDTWPSIVDAVVRHYRDELTGQAAKILGSVDFLGNPLGLMNDVSEGLSGFLVEGDVGGLLKNVTHGLSDTAAKVTGTLSDGLDSMVAVDDRRRRHGEGDCHRLRRRRQRPSGLIAGLRGLGFGLYGGMTSLVEHAYEGATTDGVAGIVAGLGRGLVGTFTRPAVGMLDLAASAASAVRDTSRGSRRRAPDPIRKRRVCVGPAGLLPRYSADDARGQELLHSINDRDYGELFIGCEPLGYSRDSLRAIISSRNVYFLGQSSSDAVECVLTIPLTDLYHCKVSKDSVGLRATCLELTTRATGTAAASSSSSGRNGGDRGAAYYNRPKVVCDTEAIANKVAAEINYAKRMSDELLHTVAVTPSSIGRTEINRHSPM